MEMRALFPAVFVSCVYLHASVLPTYHLNPAALQAFQSYVANFEKSVEAAFRANGDFWIDHASPKQRAAFEAGKAVVESRENTDIANGSIHHFSGAMHVAGGTIEKVRRVMQDYPNYPRTFKPDLGRASGEIQPDSKPADEHYHSRLFLTQNTIWFDVAYDASYDTHYLRFDPQRWEARSTTMSIRELRDAKNLDGDAYPEGEDHGFLWRTNTYWFARERNGGVDLQLDSMSLSRPIPSGFGWWGTKRTKDAVEKMLRDMKAAIS